MDAGSSQVAAYGVPKSAQPPSLPMSPSGRPVCPVSIWPPPMSPSSCFTIPPGLRPADLLDSPGLFLSSSNILESPTTGTIPPERFDSWKAWKQACKQAADLIASHSQQDDGQAAAAGFNDFSFHTATSNTMPTQASSGGGNSNTKLEDGYNWRKYGKKQGKGSQNPRIYYKCTYHNCSIKKKVERSLADGRITQIMYKGAHNHPKPLSTHCNSSGGDASEHSISGAPVPTPENSSGSFGDDEVGLGSPRAANAGGDEFDEDEPDSKRWRKDGDGEGISMAGNLKVREPRVVVQSMSDIDMPDDGYRWRKYGQKVVKGNPNPRSYYKCTTAGCPVRKHVERATHDMRAVITTYEGKHNHDVPAARGSAAFYSPVPPPADNNASSYLAARMAYKQDRISGQGSFGAPAQSSGSFALSSVEPYMLSSVEPYMSLYHQQGQNDAIHASMDEEPQEMGRNGPRIPTADLMGCARDG